MFWIFGQCTSGFHPKCKDQKPWIDCGAEKYFVWNQKVFESYESLSPTLVDTCIGSAQIISQGEVTFRFNDGIVTLLCKRAPNSG